MRAIVKVLFSKQANDIAFCLWCLASMPFLLLIIFNYSYRNACMIGVYCTSGVMMLYLLAEVAHYNYTKYNRMRRMHVLREE